MRAIVIITLFVSASALTTRVGQGSIGAQHEASLLQTYDKALSGTEVNPILRVVGLLKEMQTTLQKEMDEDESLYKELMCWCNSGSYEKNAQISDSSAKIEMLEASIESLTARVAELSTKIKELEAEVVANKEALATASALRATQLKEFHGMEMDSIQAIENLKAALVVLSKHHGEKSTNWHEFMQLSSNTKLSSGKKEEPWLSDMRDEQKEASFENYLHDSNLDESDDSAQATAAATPATPKFLQQTEATEADKAVVQRAMFTIKSFMQSHNQGPNYSSASGEILGMMKQMKETMEADLKEAQKTEAERAASFAELNTAKTQEIAEGEKMGEQKEDELANTSMELAEAKEDLEQTTAALEEYQTFLKNLEVQCKDADTNFETRKKSRLSEIEAVSQTIEILTSDEARDAANGTYSFLQVVSSSASASRALRKKAAAAVLRKVSLKTHNPEIALLATEAQSDTFAKVEKAIEGMIETMKEQQADEVKKNDWCKDKIHDNEMTNMKTEDLKADLEAKVSTLETKIKTLTDEIKAAGEAIEEAQVNLQGASADRKAENMAFQKTVADQTVTREVLLKALDKLASFYDNAEFLQKQKKQTKQAQTPPVKQMEYKKSSGAGGVVSMIEKLIHETKEITAKSKDGESEAQKAYETLIADTNDSIKDLMAEIATKTEAKAQAKKDKVNTEGELVDTVEELGDLAKMKADLHAECDYVLQNFDARQAARQAETEGLQEAVQMLGSSR